MPHVSPSFRLVHFLLGNDEALKHQLCLLLLLILLPVCHKRDYFKQSYQSYGAHKLDKTYKPDKLD